MNKSTKITSVTISNFFTIRDKQQVPLDSKVTFLYGPNSAGKSSIQKALQIIKYIFSGQGIFRGLKEGDFLWDNWLVNTSGGGIESIESIIGVRFSVDQSIFSKPPKILTKNRAKRGYVDVGFDFYLNTHVAEVSGFTLYINNEPIIYKTFYSLCLNFSHDLLARADDLERISLFESITTQNSSAHDSIKWRHLCYDEDSEWSWSVFDDFTVDDDTSQFSKKVNTIAINKYISFCNGVISAVKECVTYGWRLRSVPGSRRVPTAEDLEYSFKYSFGELLPIEGKNSDPFYETLASDFVRQWLVEYFDRRYRKKFAESHHRERLLAKSFNAAKTVNRLLDEYLHIEAGYQIQAEIKFILTSEAIDELPLKSGNKSWFFPSCEIVAILRLKDARGRVLSFDQVGSGIGYSLPVISTLTELFDIAFIEQPELHLHPALQGSLVDAVIDQVNMVSERSVVIESHSEHALLRALRRVREFESRTYIDTALGLGSDEVVVLYFEPSTSGSTKIKKIRVSASGDLLDRWPGGFFTERDEDIFQ